MGSTVDLDQLARLFARRSERVVVVLPSGEAVVLVPLAEYERLVPVSKPAPKTQSTPAPTAHRTSSPAPRTQPLEAIHPRAVCKTTTSTSQSR